MRFICFICCRHSFIFLLKYIYYNSSVFIEEYLSQGRINIIIENLFYCIMTLETYNKKIVKVSERLAQLKEQIARSAVEFNGEEHILYRWENLNNQYLKLVEKRTQLMDERLELLNEEMKRDF